MLDHPSGAKESNVFEMIIETEIQWNEEIKRYEKQINKDLSCGESEPDARIKHAAGNLIFIC